jgi:tellurite resistance protein TehA-like permease
MSTGGLAIALARTPHQFHGMLSPVPIRSTELTAYSSGLRTIGVIIFLFDLALFTLLTFCMAMRAILHSSHFRRSLTNPQEAFFLGSFFLTICIFLCNTQLYGLTYGPCGPWLVTTIRILYWFYAPTSLCYGILHFFVFMLDRPDRRPVPFSPSWFLAGYSSMLTGVLAGMIAGSQPVEHRMAILVSGVAFQGFGFLWSMVLVVIYVTQLMEKGLPPAPVRPGMFIPVGTPAYTIVAFITQARAIPTTYGYFAAHPSAAETLRTLVLFISIALWILSFWLFAIAVLACLWGFRRPGKMSFALPWWAFVFPNVGLMVATVELGLEMGSEGVLWVGSAMTIALMVIWLVTVGMCGRAVVLGEIVWPGKDEDKNL